LFVHPSTESPMAAIGQVGWSNAYYWSDTVFLLHLWPGKQR
jgi:hypothetical protein